MSFRLKNIEADLQDMINRMFSSQIDRNVEAYIDDILVKTISSLYITHDLRKIFQTIQEFSLKLNPEKCTIGVSAGKFLGFMIS